jgi:hypothetical protein
MGYAETADASADNDMLEISIHVNRATLDPASL